MEVCSSCHISNTYSVARHHKHLITVKLRTVVNYAFPHNDGDNLVDNFLTAPLFGPLGLWFRWLVGQRSARPVPCLGNAPMLSLGRSFNPVPLMFSTILESNQYNTL